MTAALVNMQIDPKEREKKYAPETVAADVPVYPWGLSVTLDEDVLEKLGAESLPKVDAELYLYAKVRVTSVSSNEHSNAAGGEQHQHRSVSLQITDLCLEEPSERKPDKDVLFKR